MVLRQIAQTIKPNLNHYNGAIFRCGGKEFYFYFPVLINCTASTVLAVCLNSITELDIEHLAMNTIGHISLSIGVIQVIPHKNTRIEQIMQQADERLY